MKIDAAYGEEITPDVVMRRLAPTLRDWEPPALPAYPWETVISEKLHAIVRLGMQNTRLRDYYDILAVQRAQEIDGNHLVQAIINTFGCRGAPAIDPDPIGLTRKFADLNQDAWSSLMAKRVFRNRPDRFADVVDEIAHLALPALEAASRDIEPGTVWRPEDGWSPLFAPTF